MTYSRGKIMGWGLKVFVVLYMVFLFTPMALSGEPSLLGSEIPLIEGARIIKEKQFKGSGRFELEVDLPPAAVAEFYHTAMQDMGWPAGRVMSVGANAGLMLMHQGDMFTVKAVTKDGLTRVTLAMVRKSTVEAALKPQPATRSDNTSTHAVAKKDKILPQNSGVTIEGAPPGKGQFVQRVVVPAKENGPIMDTKDSGSLPDDPTPEPQDPNSQDESSTSDASGRPTGGNDDSGNAPYKWLSVDLRVVMRWKVIQREYDRYEGMITLQVNGTLRLDVAASPVVRKSGSMFRPVLNYIPQAMTVVYTYDETGTSLRPIPDGHCKDPLIFAYQDSGICPMNESAGLKIQQFNAMSAPYVQNLSADKQRFLASMQGAMRVPDYYEFYVGGPGRKKTIHGRTKTPGTVDCEFNASEKSLRGFQVGIQMEIPESGFLRGTKTWSADDQGLRPPSLGIHVSDIAQIVKAKPLKPPEGGNENVTYTVSWEISPTVADAPGSEEPESEQNTSKPCVFIQNRLKAAECIKAIYQNEKVKSYCKYKYKEPNWSAYQQTVENIYKLMLDDPAVRSLDQNGLASWIDGLDTYDVADGSGLFPDPSNEFSCAIEQKSQGGSVSARMEINPKSQTIDTVLNGKSVTILKYTDGAWGKPTPTEHYWEAYQAWIKVYGEKAATALFQSSLEHEMKHAEQFRTNKDPFNIDKGSWMETGAYQKEIDVLKEFLDLLNC